MSIVRRRLLSGASWNLIDQALSALSNTVLSIVVARSATASDFGAFAIAFIVFGIFIAVTKSVVGQPLQIRFSGADMEAQSGAIRQGLGAALMIGVVAAVAVAGPACYCPTKSEGHCWRSLSYCLHFSCKTVVGWHFSRSVDHVLQQPSTRYGRPSWWRCSCCLSLLNRIEWNG